MKLMDEALINPFRPGAGHPPPYLAGREDERREFARMLEQKPVLTNLVLTGLRGVGKTVLLETFKLAANVSDWVWVGADASESASVSEESLAVRILADLAPMVASLEIARTEVRAMGFGARTEKIPVRLEFTVLKRLYDQTPGLASDKLKASLQIAWSSLATTKAKGLVLAYDEAQNLGDQAANRQYPLSLLLDVFQSLQKKQFPLLLVLTGLPTLFPKLVETRTFAERMFHVTTLGRLTEAESRDAILKPIQQHGCPVRFSAAAVAEIVKHSKGYPYFIQFLCREMFDSYMQRPGRGEINPQLTVAETLRKLDVNFFAGRWDRATERQRQLLAIAAHLPDSDEGFTVQELVRKSREMLPKPFSPSHVNQLLARLAEHALVYKNRHGRYSFAVPLLGSFIRRQDS